MFRKLLTSVGKSIALLGLTAALGYSTAAYAAQPPSPADATRIPNEIQNNWQLPEPPTPSPASEIDEQTPPQMVVPAGADKMTFTLNGIDLKGVTVYSQAKMKKLWEKDIGQRVPLLRLYQIAEEITEQYRKDGYILSRAFVPGQTIGSGPVKISVVEGYIRNVRLQGQMPSSYLLEQARAKLMAQRPLKLKTLERQMLLLNDLPGTEFRAILKPLPTTTVERDKLDATPGDVLILPHADRESSGDRILKVREKQAEAAARRARLPQPNASGQCDTALHVTSFITQKAPRKKDPHGVKAKDGKQLGEVIFLAADDDSAGSVGRKLKEAGANLNACHIVEAVKEEKPYAQVKRGSKLEHDLNAVREMLRKNKDTELIVMDPVEAYFSDLKESKANIRDVLGPLAEIAVRNHTPILAVSRLFQPSAPPPVFLPGVNPAALPTEPYHDGGVLLVIDGKPRNALAALLSIDNSQSRFLGPWLASAKISLMRGLLPYEQTDLTINVTPGSHDLRYGALAHTIPLTSDGLKLSLNASYTKGQPGYTLAPDQIESVTQTVGGALNWDAVRQRLQNLRFSVGLDSLNARTDALGSLISEDRTRALKFQAHYDEQDRFLGSTTLDMTLSHGLKGLGASNTSDTMLSRANGRPDFTTLTAQAYRFQSLGHNLSALLGFSGQLSASALLAEQQFGYGGQAFGRAYDPSQIVGDSGFAGTIELRYDGIKMLADAHLQPFTFYDIGKIWNREPGQAAQASGASAGLGVRLNLPRGTAASLLAAQPLTLRETDPQYGNGKEPRIVFSLSQAL